MPVGLCISACIVRLLYALVLLTSLLCYVYQLHDDQQISFGSAVDQMGKRGAHGAEINGTNSSSDGQHHQYPQHRGDILYVVGFMALFLFSMLSLVALCFGSRILLAIILPLHIILVVLDFLFIGRQWLKFDLINGYCSVAFGGLASFLGAIYLALLCIGGPEGANQEKNIASKLVNFKNRAPPSDRVKAAMSQRRKSRSTGKKTQK